jgi:hypothetical protein
MPGPPPPPPPEMLASPEVEVPRTITRERRNQDDHTAKHLVWVTSGLVCFVVLGLFLLPIPKQNENVLYLVSGQVIGGWLMALNYHFGTTAGTRTKDRLLAESVPASLALPAAK